MDENKVQGQATDLLGREPAPDTGTQGAQAPAAAYGANQMYLLPGNGGSYLDAEDGAEEQHGRKRRRAEPEAASPQHQDALLETPGRANGGIQLANCSGEVVATQPGAQLQHGGPPTPGAHFLPPAYMPAVCQLLLAYLQAAQRAAARTGGADTYTPPKQGAQRGQGEPADDSRHAHPGEAEQPMIVAVRQLRGFGIPAPLLLQAAAHTMVVGAVTPAQYQAVQAELGSEALVPADLGCASAGMGLRGHQASVPMGNRTVSANPGAGPGAASASVPADNDGRPGGTPAGAGCASTGADAPAMLWSGRGGGVAPVRLGVGRRLFGAIADQLPKNTELDCVLPPLNGFSGVLYLVQGSSEVGAALWDGTLLRDLGTYSSSQDARQSVSMSIKLLTAAAAALPALTPVLSQLAGRGTTAAQPARPAQPGAAASTQPAAEGETAVPAAAGQPPQPVTEEPEDVVEAAEQLLSLRNVGGRHPSVSPARSQLGSPEPDGQGLRRQGPPPHPNAQLPASLHQAPQAAQQPEPPARANLHEPAPPPQLHQLPEARRTPQSLRQRQEPPEPQRSLQGREGQLLEQRLPDQQRGTHSMPAQAGPQRADEVQQRSQPAVQSRQLLPGQQRQATAAAGHQRRLSSESLTTTGIDMVFPFSQAVRGTPGPAMGLQAGVLSLGTVGLPAGAPMSPPPIAVAGLVAGMDERSAAQAAEATQATGVLVEGLLSGPGRERGDVAQHSSGASRPRPGRQPEQRLLGRPQTSSTDAAARGPGGSAGSGWARTVAGSSAAGQSGPPPGTGGAASPPGGGGDGGSADRLAPPGDLQAVQVTGLEGQLLLELLQRGPAGPAAQLLDREVLAGLLTGNAAPSHALLGALQQLLAGRGTPQAQAPQMAPAAQPLAIDLAAAMETAELAALGGGMQLTPHVLATLQARMAAGQAGLEAASQLEPRTSQAQLDLHQQQQARVLQLDRQRPRGSGASQGQGAEHEPSRAALQARDVESAGLPTGRLPQLPQLLHPGRPPPPPQWFELPVGLEEGAAAVAAAGGGGGGLRRGPLVANSTLRDEAAYANVLQSLVSSGRLPMPLQRGGAPVGMAHNALHQELLQLGGALPLPYADGASNALFALPPRGALMLGQPGGADPGAVGVAAGPPGGGAPPMRRRLQLPRDVMFGPDAGPGGMIAVQLGQLEALTGQQQAAGGAGYGGLGDQSQAREAALEFRRYGQYLGGGAGDGGIAGGGYGPYSAADALLGPYAVASGGFPGDRRGRNGPMELAHPERGAGVGGAGGQLPPSGRGTVPPAGGGLGAEDSGNSSGALLLGDVAGNSGQGEEGGRRGGRRRQHHSAFHGS